MSDLKPRQDEPALAKVYARAQAEAERLCDDTPVTLWRAPRFGRLARATRLAAICTIAAALAAAALAAVVSSIAPRRLEFTAPVNEATPAVVQPKSPATEVFAFAQPSVPHPAKGSLAITHVGSKWRIDAVAASRLDAAQQLAQMSGTLLFGSPSSLAHSRPLDLHWEGADLGAAWRAVLDGELNYAVQCQRDRCRAWMITASEPAPSANQAGTEGMP
ncbi:MAG TPA: hypothetical protein VIY30_08975 [Burkholderiaceae bacterium]